MNLHKPTACIFVPDNAPEPQALERITHLGIGAHQDDLEIMAFHGIAACFDSDTLWFGGVACTGGGGSARTGEYSSFSDEQMREARRREQNQAARIGRYGAMIQLDYSSAEAKSPEQGELPEDLEMVI
jgi:LmbE family N-acetylglucosaminyl deacetylase